MTTYKEILKYRPDKIYINLKFEEIKVNLINRLKSLKLIDCGSILIGESRGIHLMISREGSIEIHYNPLFEDQIIRTINLIECIFKEQISSFNLINLIK